MGLGLCALRTLESSYLNTLLLIELKKGRYQMNSKIFREKLISHILWMKSFDVDYAREALKQYDTQLPSLELMQGVRDALK